MHHLPRKLLRSILLALVGVLITSASASADVVSSFEDTVGTSAIGTDGRYKAPDIVRGSLTFADGNIGRVDDDQIVLSLLVDSRPPTTTAEPELFGDGAGSGDVLSWWIDVDQNASTGGTLAPEAFGADYLVEINGDALGSPAQAQVSRWTGTAFQVVRNVSVSRSAATGFTVVMPATDLGTARSRTLRARVVTADVDSVTGDNIETDIAPKSGPASLILPGPPPPPTVATGAVKSAGPNALTIEGTINPQGSATTYFVRFGVGSTSEARTPDLSLGDGATDAPVTVTIPGLNPGTTYRYQLVGRNTFGETAGPVREGATTGGAPPVVIASPTAATTQARDVEIDRATLTGFVDGRGKPVDWWFEWGKGASLAESTPHRTLAPEEPGAQPVRATLRGLSARTRYRFRLVVQGPSGRAEGQTFDFVTTRAPTPKRLDLINPDEAGRCDAAGSCGITALTFQLAVRDGDSGRILAGPSDRARIQGIVECLRGCVLRRAFRVAETGDGLISRLPRLFEGDLGPLFKGLEIAPGATIEVRFSRSGMRGVSYRIRFSPSGVQGRECGLSVKGVRQCGLR
jgi:hypothetical protein